MKIWFLVCNKINIGLTCVEDITMHQDHKNLLVTDT